MRYIGTLFKIFHTLVYTHFSFCRLKFPRKNCIQIDGKSKASVWRNLSSVTAPKICQQNAFLCSSLLCFALRFFFKNSRFCGNYSASDSRTNTVISRARGCLLIKMAFKTVIRPIVQSCRITAMSRKTGPGVIGILLHRKQSVSKKGKQTLLISKNMLEYKQFKNVAFTGSNSYWCLSPLRTNLTSKWSGTPNVNFRKISVRKTI